MGLYLVQMADLLRHIDPLGADEWQPSAAITVEEVMQAVKSGTPSDMPCDLLIQSRVESMGEKFICRADRFRLNLNAANDHQYHINRIAYFFKHGIPRNDGHPIWLNAGERKLSLSEGRHRLAAAAIRNDEDIEAQIIEITGTAAKFLPGLRPLGYTPGIVSRSYAL